MHLPSLFMLYTALEARDLLSRWRLSLAADFLRFIHDWLRSLLFSQNHF